MVWVLNATSTRGSAGELTDITLTGYTFNMFMNHNIDLSANNDIVIQFNNDTSTNYTDRFGRNGTENTTTSNDDNRLVPSGGAFDSFIIGYYFNLSSEEKLSIIFSMQTGGSGAASDPDRDFGVGKWVNTSVQTTEADITTTSTATLGTDSNASFLGTD